jgi:hypothetical protein
VIGIVYTELKLTKKKKNTNQLNSLSYYSIFLDIRLCNLNLNFINKYN